jgi:glutathione synthase/RimK-type ligase-like ATP-grasp enzyme
VDIALVTCVELPEPDRDMAPLEAAVRAAGLSCAVAAWDDPSVDWSQFGLVLLRATWNYPLMLDAFLDWAARVDAVTRLWNPLALVRWSSHKRYLLELEARGIPVTPTVLVRQGSGVTLGEIIDARDWDEVVVKPAVSAGSFRTLRTSRTRLRQGEPHLRDLVAERDVLVQQYLPSVEGHGERALVWIDGALTHAVRKAPRFEGDREQVSPIAMSITPSEAALAERVLATVDMPMLYARVDMAPGPDGGPVIMELELVEPSLFFAQSPAALDRMVRALVREARR